jgi:hypothetical protein
MPAVSEDHAVMADAMTDDARAMAEIDAMWA